MEKTFSQDDRIRRAEEIYARRQNLRERTKRATVNVQENPKNFKLFKKLALQVVICILIYYIFYLINTTNYNFSENTLNKVKELLSYDFDFYGIYNSAVEGIDEFLYPEKNNSNKDENEVKQDEQNDKQETIHEESLNQPEISSAEESELERIKREYSFTLPAIGRISSEYGEREVTSRAITAYHKGIDIAANLGESVLSSTDGEVIISKNSPTYGNYVMIQNNEIKTVYAHCSKLLVNTGDKVTKGQEIAKVGATGDVTGAHLHFEIRINDKCINPRDILIF